MSKDEFLEKHNPNDNYPFWNNALAKDLDIFIKDHDSQIRAEERAKFESLLDVIVTFENDFICNEMCGTEYCNTKCDYFCPQKECYLQYSEYIKEQRNEGGKTMNKLEKAKEIIKENYKNARWGIFDSRNIIGDPMCSLYDDDELQIDICYGYGYFEVFGLDDEEFKELEEFYELLRREE